MHNDKNTTPPLTPTPSWQQGLNTLQGDIQPPSRPHGTQQTDDATSQNAVIQQPTQPIIDTPNAYTYPAPVTQKISTAVSKKYKKILLYSVIGMAVLIIVALVFTFSRDKSVTPVNGNMTNTTLSSKNGLVPDAPKSVTITEITSESAIISWDSVAGSEQFIIEYAADKLFADGVITKTSAEITTTLTELAPNTTYFVRLASDANNKKSSYSEVSSFTTVPLTTSNPQEVSWDTLVPARPSITAKSASTLTVTWPGVSGAERYTLEFSRSQNFSNKYTESPVDTSLRLTGLASNMTYYIRVAAVRGTTTSMWSQIVSGTTSSSSSSAPSPAPTPAPVNSGKPQSIVLSAGPVDINGTTYVTARWTPANASARAEILWTGGNTAGVARAPKGDGGAGAFSDRANGLRENTRYCFKVREYSGANAGPWSDEQCITTAKR